MPIVAEKHVEAIAIEGHRDAIGGADGVQHRGVAMQILGGAEVQGEDGAGGIVNGPVQVQRGPMPTEPVEGARIELDQGAHPRPAWAAGAIVPGPALPFGGLAQGPAQATDCGAAEGQSLDLLQLLGGVAIIQRPVPCLEQRGRALPHGRSQAARPRPSPAAVQQSRRALGREAALQAAQLPFGDVQRRRDLRARHPAGLQRLEQPDPRRFLLAHRECLP